MRTKSLALFVFSLIFSVGALASQSFACGGILDPCNLTHGGLSPGNIWEQTRKTGRDINKTANKAGRDIGNAVNKAAQDVGNALNELQASAVTGPALEAAILSSRASAMRGAMPIPPQMRARLAGYASEDSMNRVRYKIGDNGFVNLARLLEQSGFASAVTLVDVIIFRGPSEANDPSIWVHELFHVDQYRQWGVHSFAVQYARSYRGVENPAYAKGNGYWNWVQQRQQNTGVFSPVSPSRLPQRFGIHCATPFGIFTGPPAPLGVQCRVRMVQGIVLGRIIQ